MRSKSRNRRKKNKLRHKRRRMWKKNQLMQPFKIWKAKKRHQKRQKTRSQKKEMMIRRKESESVNQFTHNF